MKLSVSSYSFQQYINEKKMTQKDVVAYAKDMEFDGIEFTDITGETYEEQVSNAKEIAEEAKKLGIEISSYVIGACLCKETDEENNEEIERIKKQVDIANILGAKIMRHDVAYSLTEKYRSYKMMIPKIAENANIISNYAKQYGIKTCTENHGYIFQDSYRVEELFNAVNNENYGLICDIGNFLCADEYPQNAVSRVAPYAILVHCKDFYYYPFGTKEDNCFPTRGKNLLKGAIHGQGDVNIKQCLSILKNAGYNGWVTLEYEGHEDCIHGIEQSQVNVKKILYELDNE